MSPNGSSLHCNLCGKNFGDIEVTVVIDNGGDDRLYHVRCVKEFGGPLKLCGNRAAKVPAAYDLVADTL